MKGTIPATVKRRVGSWLTNEALGTTAWPLPSKKVSQRRRISAVSMISSCAWRGCADGATRG